MKSIWKGSISFGLVNIPMNLYSAIEPKAFKMRMLHKEKLSPIRYKKWCDECDEEVPWQDIVKGVEIAKDSYVVLTDKEIKSIKPEKSSRIEIVEFVDLAQIDPIYYDTHYYVGPQEKADKTFFLFKEVLNQTAKVAIGRLVMREKEYVCAIEAYKEGMLLTTLNYAYEIRDMKDIEGIEAKPKLSKAELDLAKQIVSKIEADEFKISQFKDTFQEELAKLVAKKKKGEKITIRPVEHEKTEERNLIEALKASLQ